MLKGSLIPRVLFHYDWQESIIFVSLHLIIGALVDYVWPLAFIWSKRNKKSMETASIYAVLLAVWSWYFLETFDPVVKTHRWEWIKNVAKWFLWPKLFSHSGRVVPQKVSLRSKGLTRSWGLVPLHEVKFMFRVVFDQGPFKWKKWPSKNAEVGLFSVNKKDYF